MTSERVGRSQSRVDGRRRLWRRLTRAVGFAVVLGLPVAALAWLVRAQASPLVAFDHASIRSATDFTRTHPELRTALLVWQELFQARWVNLAGAGLCLWVWRRHRLGPRALWAFVTLMVSWNIGLDVKLLVRRVRPLVEDAVAHAPGYSFPSGHAANTAAAGVTLTLLVWPLLRPAAKVVVPSVVVCVVLLTALDRIFLGVHYPSDTAGGILLGGALASASYFGFFGSTTTEDFATEAPR